MKPTLLSYFRLIRFKFSNWRRARFTESVDQHSVISNVRDEGDASSRYCFMVLMSCGIAMLGLLLSSPAVVIGAMLISPLMGPIMSLGFSLCVVDARQLRRSLIGIGYGLVMALSVSMFIVYLSPLTDPTPEIMARTQPNLFDLLVAIFSGLAGGYAVIKQKGETIVGVAIATALMPPLAVTGYGLAMGNMPIAQGSFFLFMTNLLAISLSVTAIAKWYGFGSHHGRGHTLWQTALMVAAFVALSFPLGIALKNIAYEAYATKVIKSAITEQFKDEKSRLSSFTISFPEDEKIRVDSLMLTRVYKRQAEQKVSEILNEKLQRGVQLTLDQIVVKKQDAVEAVSEVKPSSTLVSPMQGKMAFMTQREEMLQQLRSAIFFPTRAVQADVENKVITIQARKTPQVPLSALHQFEESLQRKYPDWQITVIPAFQALPYVFFDVGAATLTVPQQSRLTHHLWALKRWEVEAVNVIGFASTLGEYQRFNNNSLAYRRANFVAELIEKNAIKATAISEYKQPNQKRAERDYGTRSFHRVEIRVSREAEPASPEFDDFAPLDTTAP